MKNDNKIEKIITDAIPKLNDFVNRINQGSINDYLKKKSPEIDDYILDQEKKENIKFISGEVSIRSLNDSEFFVNIDLYFMSKSGDWVNKIIKGIPTKLEWEFTKEEQKNILNHGIISFEYEKPLENKIK
jgi:hypothetical protein